MLLVKYVGNLLFFLSFSLLFHSVTVSYQNHELGSNSRDGTEILSFFPTLDPNSEGRTSSVNCS